MKKYLLFATAALALASCTNESYLGTAEELATTKGEQPISFGFNVPAPTRAEGVAAATKLNNQFIVWGEKGEADGAVHTADDGGTNTHQLVFPNYQVNYAASSAYTTTSNTKDWEYVGYTHSPAYQGNVQTKNGSADPVNASDQVQTIKYWDYGASNYVFTAVSALPDDITSGRVKIVKNISGSTAYDKGYKVTLAKDASDNYPSLADLYFSDRNVISKGTGTDRTAKDAYGGNVTMNFRNSLTQVRVGMYETIPGYDVSAISFKVTGDAAAVVGSTPAFGAICPNVKADNFEGTIDVTYYTNTDGEAIENTPKLNITPGTGLQKDDLILGTNINTISTSKLLGKSASTPTWDQVDGTGNGVYTSVLPQIGNTTNLSLKVDYTLYNYVTHETITVESATATVPAEYLKWKPNYKYTYLFKISDNTNGSSGTPGTDPAGLYPITFDAVVVEAEDGQAEYITTVSEPTITTFGVNSTTGKYVTGGNEYAAGSDIYATFTEGSTVKTPTLGDSGAQHVNVFKVTTPDATNFPITEASVAEAIANPGSITNNVYTCTVAYTKVTDASTLDGSTNYYKADSESRVPGATGYVATLAVSGTDYHVDADPASSTIADGVDIYTCAVTSVTEVTDATTLAAGTTYYRKDTNTKAPGADGYIPTIAVEGTDYEVAPKIKAVNINSDASTNFTAVPAVVDTVPGEDGVNKTIDALKLTGVKAGTYAIEYTASAAWTGSYTKVYKIIVVQ